VLPFLSQVETYPDGEVLLDYCNRFGFEGVVSKRLSSRYASGPSRYWLKVKCRIGSVRMPSAGECSSATRRKTRRCCRPFSTRRKTAEPWRLKAFSFVTPCRRQ